MATYDRYTSFRTDGEVKIVPFINIGERDTDYFEVYRKNKSRLDRISHDFYGDSNYGWLILLANPDIGGLEYAIKDNTTLRIPYPLGMALQDYEKAIEDNKQYYQLDE